MSKNKPNKNLLCLLNKMLKYCPNCHQNKDSDEFYKNSAHWDGLDNWCKECRKKMGKIQRETNPEYQINYRLNNDTKLKIQRQNYYVENRDAILIDRKNYKSKYPWKRIFNQIKQRCENINNPDYKRYGLRGIQCEITVEEVQELWIRDRAFEMLEPSIDRIDNDGNYTFENCRFIEFKEHRKKDKSKIVLQFDLKGNFIKEWNSIKEASEKLKINRTGISSVLIGIYKSSGGFKWSYKNASK